MQNTNALGTLSADKNFEERKLRKPFLLLDEFISWSDRRNIGPQPATRKKKQEVLSILIQFVFDLMSLLPHVKTIQIIAFIRSGASGQA